MRSDLLATSPKIIEVNDNLNLSYTPLCLLLSSQQHELDVGTFVYKDFNISGEDEIDPKIVLPTDTEIKTLKVTEQNFSFDLALAMLKYKESQMQQRGATSSITPKIIKKMNIMFDKMAFNGWHKNYGLLNNPNTVTIPKGDAISDLNGFIVALENVKQNMISTLQVASSDIIYFIGGSALQLMLAKVDPNLKITGKDWLNTNLGSNWKEIPSFISNTNSIIAVNPDTCTLHYSALPQVYAIGVNEEEGYIYTKYASSTNAIRVSDKGGCVVSEINLAS